MTNTRFIHIDINKMSSELEQISSPLNAITQEIRKITYTSVKKEHLQYIDDIYQLVLRHHEIQEYIKIQHPITPALKRAITSIVQVIYGGRVSYLAKRPLIEKLVQTVIKFVEFTDGQRVKVGALLQYLGNYLFVSLPIPSVSIIRKALTNLVPEYILSRGRSCAAALPLLEAFFKQNPNLI
ncbi:hypothetical protein [Photobacterium phosphoreum]|uniref:hypothetical protein n=1 Tax=Photobacterium phosphoreum TaxID=659 RepID=UPI000B2FF585|nr:hypothetical protein [Photobacterium phosphoreum]PQJ84039.1 hypothetical protein BTO21_18865 [Photobacterium phosphoreum]